MFFSREHVVWVRARIPLSTRLPLVHACITARSILPHAHYGHFLFTESLCQLPTGFFYAGKTTGRGNVVGLPVVQIFKGEYSSQCSMVWRDLAKVITLFQFASKEF
jgi:hypothetical protein